MHLKKSGFSRNALGGAMVAADSAKAEEKALSYTT